MPESSSMTDRDRLATLLEAVVGPQTTTPRLIDWRSCADDLNAAGVNVGIDVERLSRASLTERRAWFVYEAARLAAAAALAPIVPEPWERRETPFRDQFVAVIDRESGPGRKASPEELHEDWVRAYEAMGWRYGPKRDPVAKTHPDMVPYWELGQLERDKDAVFVALCDIARQWVYDDDQEEAQ